MRTKNNFLWLRNITALTLVVAVFAATSLVVSASPEKALPMGELTVAGSSIDGTQPAVMLNGEKSFSGRTFFSNGTIVTAAASTATINLGSLGSVSLAPNSNLVLTFGEGKITGTLSTGQINVSSMEGVDVKIQTNAGVVGNNLKAGTMNVDANSSAAQDDDDGKVSDGSQLALILIFAGIVGATAVYLLTRDETPVGVTVSPVR